jgi:hypothetical protein
MLYIIGPYQQPYFEAGSSYTLVEAFYGPRRASYIIGFNPGSPRPWTHLWLDQGFCGANPIGPWGCSTARKAMDGWFFTTESYS